MIHEKSTVSQVLFFDSQLSLKNFIQQKKHISHLLRDVLFDNKISKV